MDGRPNLYRASRWGNDAAIFMLDARSFRDAGLPPVADPTDLFQVAAFITASFDPSRTMLGSAQKAQLLADLSAAQRDGVTWKFVVVPEPIQNLGVLAASDRFEGYAAERTEILSYIESTGIDNVVFIAADIHGTIVNNLTYQLAPFGPQISTGMFEITTGSVAFDAPFGPTVAGIAASLGLISPPQYAFYLSLPTAQQDLFLQSLIDSSIQPLGYDPIGLQGSPVDATLLEGGYIAVHVFGWTEFEINDSTQDLTVTTWGIEPYTEAELLRDPTEVVSRTPVVVSKFVIAAAGFVVCIGDLNGDGEVGGADLGALLSNWGGAGSGDLDGNGTIDGADLALLLDIWGDCPIEGVDTGHAQNCELDTGTGHSLDTLDTGHAQNSWPGVSRHREPVSSCEGGGPSKSPREARSAGMGRGRATARQRTGARQLTSDRLDGVSVDCGGLAVLRTASLSASRWLPVASVDRNDTASASTLCLGGEIRGGADCGSEQTICSQHGPEHPEGRVAGETRERRRERLHGGHVTLASGRLAKAA